MKSERRHELQQNDLAIYLNKINKAVEPYSRFVALAACALLVGAIAWGLYRNQQTGKRSDATLQLIQASATQDAEDLLTVSESYPNTVAGDWARLYQGDQYLAEGIQSLYNDRTNAEQLLQDAQLAFENALSRSKDRLLVSRAHLGIARAAESLGKLDEAIAAYEDVIAVNESEAMVKLAQDRIDTLNNPETENFLAWFSDQDFSPADPSLPPSLPGANTLPEMPDLSLPELSLDSDGEMEERDLDGGIGLPEIGSETPPSETPAEGEGDDAGGIELPQVNETPAPSGEGTAPETEATEATATEAAEVTEATEPSSEASESPPPAPDTGSETGSDTESTEEEAESSEESSVEPSAASDDPSSGP